jgi:hypothetical protein
VASSKDCLLPPLLDRQDPSLGGDIQLQNVEPTLNRISNARGEPAMQEEVRRRLRLPLTKLAYVTIWPSSPLKPVRRPYPIHDDKPRKEFALGRPPITPNDPCHVGGHSPLELRLVGRGRRVNSIGREVPDYAISLVIM